MTGALWLGNLAAYLVQSTLVIGAGAALARLLSIRDARVALAYWRALLVACLLLPVCQRWQPRPAPDFERRSAMSSPIEYGLAIATASGSGSTPWPLDRIALAALAAGIVVRGGWLIAGAFGLRRLRRRASRLDPPPAWVRAAQEQVGARADIRVSDRVSGPITFGILRPVIVFPPHVLSLEAPVQEAIACHELLHVQRRDCVDEIAEEAVRTLLWFHPAARWLIGQVQLGREQVVDRAVVALTRSSERYVDALLAVAFMKARTGFLPAPLFLRRRFLKTRIVSLLEESTMSTRRLFVTLAASAAALVVAATLSVRLFPLQASVQEAGGPPVQIVSGGEGLRHGSMPEYPGSAIERRIEGDLVVQLSIDENGGVSDARVLAGPEELKNATLRSVLEWHFSPTVVRSNIVQVTLRFRAPAPDAAEATGWAFKRENNGELTPGQRIERQMTEIQQALQEPALSAAQKDELKTKLAALKQQLENIHRHQTGEPTRFKMASGGTVVLMREERPDFASAPTLTQIRSERVPQETLARAVEAAGVQIGDRINEDAAKRIKLAVASVDTHFRIAFGGDGKGGLVLTIVAP